MFTSDNRASFEKSMKMYPVNSIRSNVIILVLLLLDLFLVIPLVGNPYIAVYVYVLLPPIVMINIWALVLVIMPRKLQLNYILFRGVFGLVCSIGFMIMTQKFVYGMLGLDTIWYFIGSFALYGVALYYFIKYNLAKFKDPSNHKKKPKVKEKNKRTLVVTITTFTGAGYLIANVSLGFATQQLVATVLISVYSMLACVLFHFIMDLHRYYWLHKLRNQTTD
ncbi:hypothetical protein [Paenibacillus sp. S25]|uniref:hypothetical protein n=1 Tax=Paenibacillus sp. S25 TaxID=2823905 RepID=UPI001C647540|nr:hypothetical protein [Paenibacillus sp. S25]QYK63794.1 hypothetical protein KAI37_04143 [Paenibacillus sp. S25]